MEKQAIRRVAAVAIPADGLRGKPNLIRATDVDGRTYYAKNRYCKKAPSGSNPAWIGNELLYYAIALQSGLQMPESAILKIDNQLYWGSEALPGREALSRVPKEGNEQLRKFCYRSDVELVGLARALLLDVALLNSDRQLWNILADDRGRLWYFDHDKSLLGDGREPNDNPYGDLARIEDASLADSKVGDYLACPIANKLFLCCLSDQQVREIFNELALNGEVLNSVKADCPREWVSGELFARLARFLERWWKYLRPRLCGENPRRYLTHILLQRGFL